MNIVGEMVFHEEYGCGSVVSQTEKSITVEFSERGQEEFAYPGCFEKLLRLCDPLAQREQMEKLAKKRESAAYDFGW